MLVVDSCYVKRYYFLYISPVSKDAKQSLIKFAAKNRRIPIYLVNTTTVQILTRQRTSFSHLRAAILFDKRK